MKNYIPLLLLFGAAANADPRIEDNGYCHFPQDANNAGHEYGTPCPNGTYTDKYGANHELISGVYIDGDGLAQGYAHIVFRNYSSRFEDLSIRKSSGDNPCVMVGPGGTVYTAARWSYDQYALSNVYMTLLCKDGERK